MQNRFSKQGVRLNMMVVLIAVLCAVYAISAGFYTVSEAIRERDSMYLEEVENYEYVTGLWNTFSGEYSAEEIEEAIGPRPEEPIKSAISFNMLYEGFSQIFIIAVLAVFLCSALSFFGDLCLGACYVLSLQEEKKE